MNEIRWITNGIRACFYLNVASAVFLSFSVCVWFVAATAVACAIVSALFERELRKLDD